MSRETTDAIVVFTTVPDAEEAGRLAKLLVDARLAACVQLVHDIDSVYRWQGRVEQQREVLLIAKTTVARFAELEQVVRVNHSYETPEIVAVPIVAGSRPYLQWLTGGVIGDDSEETGAAD